LGAIEFVNGETLTTTPDPIAYCYEIIAEGMNPIDTITPGIFIPFRIKTNAMLGEDSLYTNSSLQATTGVIYNNIELPVENDGQGSIYAHFLYISADDWASVDSTTISFNDESGNCVHEITVYFAYDAIYGEDFANHIAAIQIYPNPASEILTINFTQNNFIAEKITLYNMFGQSLYEISPTKLLPDTSFNLDVSSLSNGTYFIAAFNKKGQLVAKRFVKE